MGGGSEKLAVPAVHTTSNARGNGAAWRPEQMVLHVQTPRLRSCTCFARWLRLSLSQPMTEPKQRSWDVERTKGAQALPAFSEASRNPRNSPYNPRTQQEGLTCKHSKAVAAQAGSRRTPWQSKMKMATRTWGNKECRRALRTWQTPNRQLNTCSHGKVLQARDARVLDKRGIPIHSSPEKRNHFRLEIRPW